MKTTTKERALMMNIANNELTQSDELEDLAVWSDCLQSQGVVSYEPLPTTSIPGILSSLCNKGICWSNGECCGFTEEGAAEFRRLGLERVW